jgi:hypothetical protein
MWWDQAGFDLRRHGDRCERSLWPRFQRALSQYEVLWLKYVVPLTNRINSQVSPTDDCWIMLRAVSTAWERFAMSHYSTFYYFSRASALMRSSPQYHESVFNLLRMSTYNLYRLLASCDELVRPGSSVRLTDIVKNSPVCNTIKLYRDVLLKNPVLGRSRAVGPGSLPDQTVLLRVLGTHKKQEQVFWWHEAQQLKPSDFVKATQVMQHCHDELAQELQSAWSSIDKVFEPQRSNPDFLASMGLDSAGHVAGDLGRVLLLDVSSPAASGDLL